MRSEITAGAGYDPGDEADENLDRSDHASDPGVERRVGTSAAAGPVSFGN